MHMHSRAATVTTQHPVTVTVTGPPVTVINRNRNRNFQEYFFSNFRKILKKCKMGSGYTMTNGHIIGKKNVILVRVGRIVIFMQKNDRFLQKFDYFPKKFPIKNSQKSII